MSMLMGSLLIKRIKMQGSIVFEDYGHRYNEFSQDMQQWLAAGKIKYREDLVEGLEILPNPSWVYWKAKT